MENKGLKIAESYAKDARKAAKGSWFSKPEWDIAAKYWDQAAVAYKTVQHYHEAIDCYTKASDGYSKSGAIYLAAKGSENAASLAEKHLTDHSLAVKYYTQASDLFRSHGSSAERAAEMMERAAKLCEDIDVEQAIQLYDNALTIYEAEDRGRFGVETFKKTTGFLISKKKFTEAVDIQMRLSEICRKTNNKFELNKSQLSCIIILLAFGDDVEAGKKMDEFGQDALFIRTHESEAAGGLLQAYEDANLEVFHNITSGQTVSFLDAAVVRLAAKIRVPGAVKQPIALPAVRNPSGVSSTPVAANEPVEVDDDDDDLL